MATMERTIFNELFDEYNRIRYEIEKIRKEEVKLAARRETYLDMLVSIQNILFHYGSFSRDGYEPYYEIAKRDAGMRDEEEQHMAQREG